MVHGTGQPDVVSDLVIHPELVTAARSALRSGAPILCDAYMVATGITAGRLPAANDVHCFLREPGVPALARQWNTTRTAAAVSLWEPLLDGAVVAIGNAPTALFHLLEMLLDGAPRPAAIVGCPVGIHRRRGVQGRARLLLPRSRHRHPLRDGAWSARGIGDDVVGDQRAGLGGRMTAAPASTESASARGIPS